MKDDVDRAIEDYRAQLAAEAELARGDLAEIEDHLRTLIEQLRAEGLPVGEAITLAARRLGDPRQLAREHARVRTPFGAKLSRTRAYSAAALLAPGLVFAIARVIQQGLGSFGGFELVILVGMMAALAARQTWARAIVLGLTANTVLAAPFYVALRASFPPVLVIQLVCYLGAFAFVVPWRRGELSRLGLALALLGPAYAAASFMMYAYLTAPGHHLLEVPWGALAMFGVYAAGAGILLRARWAAGAALVAAFALAESTLLVSGLTFRVASPELVKLQVLFELAGGAVGASLAAMLAWRAARSTLGTLRGVLS